MNTSKTNSEQSRYWLDQTAAEILKSRKKSLKVSSGHSPSGRYHIGLIRELTISNALVAAMNNQGAKAEHIDFVDDFDVLRKIPAGVPESFQEHLGKPLYLAPDPLGCHDSYADHYLDELYKACEQLGVHPTVYRSHQEYKKGVFTGYIRQSLSRLKNVRKIIEEVSHRKLPSDWAPVQLLSDNNDLREWQYAGWDGHDTITYKNPQGEEGEINFAKEPSRVKLDWRLDWPARWHKYQVDVEPFGRDHATKGGSYDTGKTLIKEIFNGEAPYPVPYDFVNVVGQTKKMSKSEGGVITPLEALDIMPPEILRYFMIKSLPKKLLNFDSGLGLIQLVNEYKEVAIGNLGFEEAYKYSRVDLDTLTISHVPFQHLVALWQSTPPHATFDEKAAYVRTGLVRTGYDEKSYLDEFSIIERELKFINRWLENYAPEEVKFSVQKNLPKVDLSPEDKKFLAALADKIESAKPEDGQAMHELIYAAKDELGLKPAEAFKAVYQVIINKTSGPKAGWFLASLDRDWLVNRLRLKDK